MKLQASYAGKGRTPRADTKRSLGRKGKGTEKDDETTRKKDKKRARERERQLERKTARVEK